MFSASQNPENFNLPSDYTFSENFWGNLFYKIYSTSLNYGNAKAQCESDGTFLAIPRSETENDFFAGLIPNENFWIGINDIEQEGSFVAVNGREVSWTHWRTGEPNGGTNENAVEILNDYSGNLWNDIPACRSLKFICFINIEGKLVSFFRTLHVHLSYVRLSYFLSFLDA